MKLLCWSWGGPGASLSHNVIPCCTAAPKGNSLYLLCTTSEHGHEACAPLSSVPSSSCLSAGLRRNIAQPLLPLLYVKWESLATGLTPALAAECTHSLALIEALSFYALPRTAQGYFFLVK